MAEAIAAPTVSLLVLLRRMRSRVICTVQRLLPTIKGQAKESTSRPPPSPCQPRSQEDRPIVNLGSKSISK